MGKVKLDEQHLFDIADAIRAKRHVQQQWKPGEMAQAISAINVDNKAAEMINSLLFDPGYSWGRLENANVMNITADAESRTFISEYKGGSQIGWWWVFPILIPPIFTKLHYKITTGARSYDTSYRFSPAVGLLPRTNYAGYIAGQINIYLGNSSLSWLKMDYVSARNSVLTGEFDLSDLTEPYVFVICGPGWDAEYSELFFS